MCSFSLSVNGLLLLLLLATPDKLWEDPSLEASPKPIEETTFSDEAGIEGDKASLATTLGAGGGGGGGGERPGGKQTPAAATWRRSWWIPAVALSLVEAGGLGGETRDCRAPSDAARWWAAAEAAEPEDEDEETAGSEVATDEEEEEVDACTPISKEEEEEDGEQDEEGPLKWWLSCFRHLARRFWNQTCVQKGKQRN